MPTLVPWKNAACLMSDVSKRCILKHPFFRNGQEKEESRIFFPQPKLLFGMEGQVFKNDFPHWKKHFVPYRMISKEKTEDEERTKTHH